MALADLLKYSVLLGWQRLRRSWMVEKQLGFVISVRRCWKPGVKQWSMTCMRYSLPCGSFVLFFLIRKECLLSLSGTKKGTESSATITLLRLPGKIFFYFLKMRIRSHLLKCLRPKKSGFTSGKSTTDRIREPSVLVELRLEFRQGLLASYNDLTKAFDSVFQEALWDLLWIHWIAAKIDDLSTGLYCGSEYWEVRGRHCWFLSA